MEVIEKAKELAVEIMKTSEYARLVIAREAIEEDDYAAGLIQDMTLMQREYLTSAREGADKRELAIIENLMKKKHEEIMECEISGELIRAKADFDNLIEIINNEIMSSIEQFEKGGGDNLHSHN